MSPIQIQDYLYVGGYSKKSMLLKLKPERSTPDIVWQGEGDIAVSPVNVQPFVDWKKEIIDGMDQSGDLRDEISPEVVVGNVRAGFQTPAGQRNRLYRETGR